MKNRIRLTESQLHNVIKESVKKMIDEISYLRHSNNNWKYNKIGDPKDNEKWSDCDDDTDDVPRGTKLVNTDAEWARNNKSGVNESLTEGDNYLDNEWENAYSLGNNKICQQKGHGKTRQFRTIGKPKPQPQSFNDDYNNDGWENVYSIGKGKVVQQKGDAKHRQFRTIGESQLHQIVRKTIKKALNESKTVQVGEYAIKFDDDSKTILSVNGWRVQDQQAAIQTMGEDVYQQALQQIQSKLHEGLCYNNAKRGNNKMLNEIGQNWTPEQWANLAGQAMGSKKDGISGMFNRGYNKRKQRQAELFAKKASDNNYHSDLSPVSQTSYEHDYAHPKMNPERFDGNNNAKAFNIYRGQYSRGVGKDKYGFDTYINGSANGQRMDSKEYRDQFHDLEDYWNGHDAAYGLNSMNNAFDRGYQVRKTGQPAQYIGNNTAYGKDYYFQPGNERG